MAKNTQKQNSRSNIMVAKTSTRNLIGIIVLKKSSFLTIVKNLRN